MRTIQLQLKPTQVRITQEEILADLRYPARKPKARDGKDGPRGGR